MARVSVTSLQAVLESHQPGGGPGLLAPRPSSASFDFAINAREHASVEAQSGSQMTSSWRSAWRCGGLSIPTP
jgi:hypothetical protein